MCFMQTESVLQTKNRSGLAKYRFSVALHLMYFDLYTIMILFFSNSQVWASIVDPDQIASEGGEPDHSKHCLSFSLQTLL